MNAQIWYVVLLSVTVIAALIGTSIVLGQSKNGPGEDHYIDLDPQMQGEPYATPVIVGDDGVTRQKDIVHDIKQMPDDTAIVDVLYAGSKKGSKDDTKAEHMTMKKVDVRRLGLKPGTTVTLHVVDGAITLIERGRRSHSLRVDRGHAFEDERRVDDVDERAVEDARHATGGDHLEIGVELLAELCDRAFDAT